MGLSKRAFSKKYNFEVQWLSSLCDQGIVPFEIKKGKRNSISIDENIINILQKGLHYVECPICMKKMACITKAHFRACKVENENPYCDLFFINHKKTEEQKDKQSKKLKERFRTIEGDVTRKEIGEASKKFNAEPEFKTRKIKKSKEVQARPEIKKMRSENSLEMWADPVFRARNKKYIEENLDKLKESAKKARQYLKKTSKLHLGYKKTMLEVGLTGFMSEYPYGPYSIDEADPFAKIALEIDGCYWHGCKTCDLIGDTRIKNIDKRKTSYLKNRGWIILRIKEHEIKKDPFVALEMIRNIQEKRKSAHKEQIKKAFFNGSLKVLSMVNKEEEPKWVSFNNVVRHHTPHKKMISVETELGSVTVTEDHSLFDGKTKEPIQTLNLKKNDTIIGLPGRTFESIKVLDVKEVGAEKYTYDLSVPEAENFVLDSGILAHNTYSISGVSLDIEKSSKYMSIKDEFINEYDKLVEAAKRSIKIVKGLRQFRYGVGITSALGPLSRPGIQSRRNMVEAGSVGTWS